MRVLLPLFLLLVPGLGADSSAHEPKVHWRRPGVFDQSLPPCSKIRWTRRSLCAITAHSAYWLDGAGSAWAQEMGPDEPGSVLLDATSWDKRSAEVWRGADGLLHVSADLGDGWRPRPIPADLQPVHSPPTRSALATIAASGETLAVCADAAILRFENGRWSRIGIDLRGHTLEHGPRRALLVGRELYLALDSWQSEELVVADIDSGRAQYASDAFPEGAKRVLDLDLGPDGRVYVTWGALGLSTGGQLLVRAGDSWQALASSPVRPIEVVCGNEPQLARPVPKELSQDYLALAFDGQNRACLLTSEQGILRRESDGSWTCITPGWWDPELDVCDLEVVDDSALFASMRVGVLTLDLSTLEGRRVRAR